jgi:single-strand DNA-binding protein
MICVVGRLQIRDWTDKNGNKRRNAEIVVDNAYFTGEKRERAAANQPHVEADDYRDGTQAAPAPQQQYELARKPEYTYDINHLQQAYPQNVRIADDGDYDDGDGDLPF